MITKTLNLDKSYQELFDEVREKSEGAIDVNNLDAFYGSIEEIASLDPKFLRLPLDEPLFDIDANTRRIAIPDVFRTNGISVQKDHLAEVIFFRIERYFDYTDLSTCDIVINWKIGSKEGKTTRFIKFEKPFTIDDVKSNYIVFGWPINDIVTEKSGALNFAVEFFKTDDNQEIIYRFNTLPASVNIKDGLILSNDIESISLDDDIIRTLVNSKFGEGTAAVDDVVWRTGDGNGLVIGTGLEDNVILLDYVPTVYLNTTLLDGVPSSDIINFYAEGYVDAGTKIRYTDANNNPINATALKVNRPRVLVNYESDSGKLYYASALSEEPLTDSEAAMAEELWAIDSLNPNYKYFKMAADNALVDATEEDIANWGTENAVDLYITVAKLSVNNVGSYVIKAQGYKTDNEGNKIGNGDVKATSIVTIPMPETPSAINITTSDLDALDENYSFEEGLKNILFLNAEGLGTLTASAELEHFGALQFIWQKKNGNAFVNIASENIDFLENNSSLLEINEAGVYKVNVINFLNNRYTEPISSAEILASPLAGKITNAIVKGAVGSGVPINIPVNSSITYNSAGRLSVNSITLSINENDVTLDGQKGNFEFEWYKEELNEELESTWVKIENATSNQYKITQGDGVYKPVIKNNYNGSIYTYELNSVVVNDNAT